MYIEKIANGLSACILQTLRLYLTDYQFAISNRAPQTYGHAASHCNCYGHVGTAMVDFAGTVFAIDRSKARHHFMSVTSSLTPWAPSQYPNRRIFVRSRKVSKPRDLYLELPDRSEIWQAYRQHCCRCTCQISKRCDNLKYQSRGFETSRDLTKRRYFGYWDGAQDTISN